MRIAIIGNGRAGSTTARVLRETYGYAVDVFSDEGALHYSRPALMYVSMGAVDASVVVAALPDAQHRTIDSLDELDGYDAIVITTGSMPALPNWCAMVDEHVQCYTQWSDVAHLEHAIVSKKRCVVIGGGLLGAEVAEVLHHRSAHYQWLLRDGGVFADVLPREESELITRHMQDDGIRMALNADVVSIVREGARVTGVLLHSGEIVPCDHVIMATGARPSIALAQRAGIPTDVGIVVDASFRTSRPNTYAVGDCAQPPWGLRATWHDARAQGEHVAHVIAGTASAYLPRLPSMQAKFLRKEWYSVGAIDASTSSWYWEDPLHQRSVRLHHIDSVLVGVQTVGVRLNRDVCEEWIRQARTVDDARGMFARAVVDPEFTPKVTL